MTAKVITDVLRSVRLQGTLCFEAQLAAPWGFHFPADRCARFHHVVSGSCWVSVEDGPWNELAEGEAILFPQGSTHRLASEPEADTVDGQCLLAALDADGVIRLGGSGPRTGLVCGHFTHHHDIRHPLLDALPAAIRSSADRHPGWTGLAQLAVARANGPDAGPAALTDRLAEVFFLDLLSGLGQQTSGFLAALADPAVGPAVQAMHDDLATNWTVASLAAHVAISRSVLASRFTELVGESPIRYLTRWRMHEAARLLRETTLPAGRIAIQVGYGSPFSFTKAFVREVGVAPSVYRHKASRAARASSS